MHNNKNFNLFCWNANSITNKFEEILLALIENNIDILALNETKINESDEILFLDNNYNCTRGDSAIALFATTET